MTTQAKHEAANKLRADLSQFLGSESFYRHAINRTVVYTEGVRHFAENAGNGAYWLLDILATEPAILKEAHAFVHVILSVAENRTATLTVTDGDKGPGAVTVYYREITFTDCPVSTWEFFFENLTVMLPSER